MWCVCAVRVLHVWCMCGAGVVQVWGQVWCGVCVVCVCVVVWCGAYGVVLVVWHAKNALGRLPEQLGVLVGPETYGACHTRTRHPSMCGAYGQKAGRH